MTPLNYLEDIREECDPDEYKALYRYLQEFKKESIFCTRHRPLTKVYKSWKYFLITLAINLINFGLFLAMFWYNYNRLDTSTEFKDDEERK